MKNKTQQKILLITTVILGIVFIIGFFPTTIGYHYGPYQVQKNDTLELILNNYFQDTWITQKALQNLKPQLDINNIWSNKSNNEPDGDIVKIKGNKLSIIKPNQKIISARLLPLAIYTKRIIQAIYYLIWFLSLTLLLMYIILQIYKHPEINLTNIQLKLSSQQIKYILKNTILPIIIWMLFINVIMALALVMIFFFVDMDNLISMVFIIFCFLLLASMSYYIVYALKTMLEYRKIENLITSKLLYAIILSGIWAGLIFFLAWPLIRMINF